MRPVRGAPVVPDLRDSAVGPCIHSGGKGRSRMKWFQAHRQCPPAVGMEKRDTKHPLSRIETTTIRGSIVRYRFKNQDGWKVLPLSPVEKLRLQQDLALLEFLEPEIKAIDEELARLSCCDPWKETVPYLMQLPGFGLIVVTPALSAQAQV